MFKIVEIDGKLCIVRDEMSDAEFDSALNECEREQK